MITEDPREFDDRIGRFSPPEERRKERSIEARFSWPRATARRVKGSFFFRSSGQRSPFAFDLDRSPKTGPSGCAIGRQGSAVFPRNVCTMTRRMPLVHFHRRPRAHARPRTRAVTFEIRSKEGRGNSDSSCTPSWRTPRRLLHPSMHKEFSYHEFYNISDLGWSISQFFILKWLHSFVTNISPPPVIWRSKKKKENCLGGIYWFFLLFLFFL